jgi:A/G-specific adenine glycosylase
VMDLGATVCVARKPACNACPLSSQCPSAFTIQTVAKPRRSEPTFRGEPQRLWRGRVVELLRSLEQMEWMDLDEMENRLLGSCSDTEQAWLETLISALERDGFVIRRNWQVRLAD